jgi:hypothetical protein
MEGIVVADAIIEAVIIAVRNDLIKMLTATECCKRSKRKLTKLVERLRKSYNDEEAIYEAKVKVRESLSKLSPLRDETSEMSYDDRVIIPSDSLKADSIIHQFVKKLTNI